MENKITHESFLEIKNKNEEIVFEIRFDGSVYWMVKGKLTKARTDKNLGDALGRALYQLIKLHWPMKDELKK